MGKQIHLGTIERLFDKSPIVDFKSIERVVGVTKKSNYAKVLVSNLLKKGKIHKVAKGFYTKHPEISLAVFAYAPAYLGLQCALSHLGIWEQETIPVLVTTRKVRGGIRSSMGSNILIRHLERKYFFGFDFTKDGDWYLPYSDLEKTFIDMLVFNQTMSDDLLTKIKIRIDPKRLRTYLKKYPDIIRRRVANKLLRDDY